MNCWGYVALTYLPWAEWLLLHAESWVGTLFLIQSRNGSNWCWGYVPLTYLPWAEWTHTSSSCRKLSRDTLSHTEMIHQSGNRVAVAHCSWQAEVALCSGSILAPSHWTLQHINQIRYFSYQFFYTSEIYLVLFILNCIISIIFYLKFVSLQNFRHDDIKRNVLIYWASEDNPADVIMMTKDLQWNKFYYYSWYKGYFEFKVNNSHIKQVLLTMLYESYSRSIF